MLDGSKTERAADAERPAITLLLVRVERGNGVIGRYN